MTEEFSADGQVVREQGASDHSGIQPLQERVRRLEEWLNEFYVMYGYAAHGFLVGTIEHMNRREFEMGRVATDVAATTRCARTGRVEDTE
ncbi:hypothetical protein [Nocardia wallacei]|uniref:hypothetical protein n=1 Tax=Nocardia wallacei TaxID=480035 RepID=UPI002454AE3E|nr:hypothetical protein [Nocardia wallacei]